jgi:hypothetical protein
MSGGKGMITGLPEDNSEGILPLIEGAPTWYRKLTEWMRYRKTCQLKAGMGGTYCRWSGGACCYNHCPARLFEEVTIGLYPEEIVPEPVKDRVRHVDEALQELTKRVNKIAAVQKKSIKAINANLKEINEAIKKD